MSQNLDEITALARCCVEYCQLRDLTGAARDSTAHAYLEGAMAACRETDSLIEIEAAILLARFDLYGFDTLTEMLK